MPPKAKVSSPSEAQQKQERADARRERNRVAAQRSRDRKVEEFGTLHVENAALKKEVKALKARLKLLEGGGGAGPSNAEAGAGAKGGSSKRKASQQLAKEEQREEEEEEEDEDELEVGDDSIEEIFDLDEEKPPGEGAQDLLDKLPQPAIAGRISAAFAGLKGILGGGGAGATSTESPAASRGNSQAPPSSGSHASFAPPETFNNNPSLQSAISAAAKSLSSLQASKTNAPAKDEVKVDDDAVESKSKPASLSASKRTRR